MISACDQILYSLSLSSLPLCLGQSLGWYPLYEHRISFANNLKIVLGVKIGSGIARRSDTDRSDGVQRFASDNSMLADK